MNRTEHLLQSLSEEGVEVAKAVSKALKFGLQDGYPGMPTTNAQDIVTEAQEFIAVLEILEDEGIVEKLPDHEKEDIKKAKKERLSTWMGYAREKGTLEDMEVSNNYSYLKNMVKQLSGDADRLTNELAELRTKIYALVLFGTLTLFGFIYSLIGYAPWNEIPNLDYILHLSVSTVLCGFVCIFFVFTWSRMNVVVEGLNFANRHLDDMKRLYDRLTGEEGNV